MEASCQPVQDLIGQPPSSWSAEIFTGTTGYQALTNFGARCTNPHAGHLRCSAVVGSESNTTSVASSCYRRPGVPLQTMPTLMALCKCS
nr:hypothetical protein CFP56_02821 [Quercus suber]